MNAELREAIDQEQLHLRYQYLVDGQTSLPAGVEGLIRWDHPSRGLLTPDEFLPFAEESDAIVEIDHARRLYEVLDDAAKQRRIDANVGGVGLVVDASLARRLSHRLSCTHELRPVEEVASLQESSAMK